jgi:hypothetical protein
MRLSLILLIAMSTSCGPGPTIKEQYPGAWGSPSGDVARTLAKNGVRGCGEFFQKASVKDSHEYAVACSRTPEGAPGWVGYLVWPATGAVTGPDYTAVWDMGGPPRGDPR